MAGFLAGIAVGTAAKIITAPIDAYIGAQIKPVAMWWGYDSWKDFPIMLPPAGEIINAYQRGWFRNPQDPIDFLRYLGVSFTQTVRNKKMKNAPGYQTMWDAVAKASEVQPSIEMAIQALQRGIITDDKDFYNLMMRNNANETSWLRIASMLMEVPSIAEILRAWNMGLIDAEQFKKLAKRAGIDPDLWPMIFESFVDVPSAEQYQILWNSGRIDRAEYRAGLQRNGVDVDRYERLSELQFETLGISELMVARNRQAIGDLQFNDGLLKLGIKRDEDRAILDELRELIPGPSDLVRFGVYHVFTPEIANALLLYDERPDALDKWHDASGLHKPLGFQIVSDGVQRDAKWADLYWGAHWRKLGADSLATFLHRFRPDQIARYRALGFNVDVFDMPKMRTLLRMDDYPKWSRDYLAAVSFRPPDFRWVMRGINTGVYNEKQSRDAFLDHGYAQDTAEDMTKILLKQKEQRDEAPLIAFGRKLASAAIKEIGHAYKIGAITREAADTAVKGFGLERALLGPMFDGIDLQLSNELISSVITAIKKAYLAGASTTAEATAQLISAGITQARAVVYLAGWTALLSVNRKMATATQILGWLRGGLLSTEVAALRLKNLGWGNADTLLLLAESQAKVAKAEAATMEREDRSRAKQAKDLEAQHAKLQAAQRSVENRIRQLTPISKLQKWYAADRITRQYFMGRLTAMGIPPDVRIQLEKEAMDSRAKLISKAEKDSQAAVTQEMKVEASKQTTRQPEAPPAHKQDTGTVP